MDHIPVLCDKLIKGIPVLEHSIRAPEVTPAPVFLHRAQREIQRLHACISDDPQRPVNWCTSPPRALAWLALQEFQWFPLFRSRGLDDHPYLVPDRAWLLFVAEFADFLSPDMARTTFNEAGFHACLLVQIHGPVIVTQLTIPALKLPKRISKPCDLNTALIMSVGVYAALAGFHGNDRIFRVFGVSLLVTTHISIPHRVWLLFLAEFAHFLPPDMAHNTLPGTCFQAYLSIEIHKPVKVGEYISKR